MSNDPEFVTVTEASKLLGVHERRVRRHMAKMTDADRRTSDDGLQRVRVSALRASIRGGIYEEKQASDASDSDGRSSDESSQSTVKPSVMSSDSDGQRLVEAELRAQIAQGQSEIEFLRESLTRSQENEAKALTRLAESEDRAKLLLAAVATGRLPSYGTSGDTEEGDVGQGGVPGPVNVPEEQNDCKAEQLGFFGKTVSWWNSWTAKR